MKKFAIPLIIVAVLVTAAFLLMQRNRPLESPIQAEPVIVDVVEFASIPHVGGEPARMMRLLDETATNRLFVNDMRGPIYSVSYHGEMVTEYINIDDPRWGVDVQSLGRERGMQSFAFHPQFGQADTPGYGKFYTWTDTANVEPEADFKPGGSSETHHTVLLEWTAKDPLADTYDGAAPRELMRFEQPFGNHNGGHLAFNPTAEPDDPDYGLLYIGVGDGGAGGDPFNMAQNLASGFGKVLRIDPLGSNSANGEYGIPSDNPYANDGELATLGEIFASGVRNPQRFDWDPANDTLYLADIGQNMIEEISIVTAGANLGWNIWEGSVRFTGGEDVSAAEPRSDPTMTYPVVEYAHDDPLLLGRVGITGVIANRASEIPQIRNRVLFGDFPSGEIFYFSTDDPPSGGNEGIGRILLRHQGETMTLLELIRARNAGQGLEPASRADLRFDQAADGRVFLLNKHDGAIRLLVP